MSFSEALEILKKGKKITRKNWNGKGMYLKIYIPSNCEKITQPFIYIKTVGCDYIPWVASQSDLLSNDWEVINE